MLICTQDVFSASESANQHEKCGLGKMKIRNQSLHCEKPISGINKQIRFTRARLYFALGLPRRVL